MRATSAEYDAIVVGSGIGGLAAATRLSQHDLNVLVLEASSDFGGYIRPLESGAYVFDLGVHYLGKLGRGEPFRALLDELGLDELEFVELDPDAVDRYVFPDYQFEFCTGKDRLADRLIGDFPDQSRAVARFLDLAVQIYDASAPAALATGGPASWIRYFARHPLMLRYGRLDYQSFLDGITADRRLQAVLSAPLFDVAVGPRQVSTATALSVWGYYLDGAYYPRGGSKAIRDAFVTCLRRRDVTLVDSAPVVSLEQNGGTWVAHTSNGGHHRSRIVISNADPAVTVCALLGEGAVPRRQFRRAARLRPSGSIFTVFVGTDLDLTARDFPTGNICQYGSWDLTAYYDGWGGLSPPSAERGLFINSPSARDPQTRFAPVGEHTLQLLSGWSYDSVAQWASPGPDQRAAAYDEYKTEVIERFLAAAQQQLPNLTSHLTHIDCITPLDCESTVRAVRGGIYGPAHIPSQMGPGRFQSLTCGPEGLYLAGAGTFGCGLFYCAASGRVAAEKGLAYLKC